MRGEISFSAVLDGSDMIPAAHIVRSGAELRMLWFNQVRRAFLDEQGEDFFQKEPQVVEDSKKAQWTKEANKRFPDQGDYTIPLNMSTGKPEYYIEEAVFLGNI